MNQNFLKGLLILLVIFDHNEYAHQLFPKFLEGFSFHVVGFFALPFLRPSEIFSFKRLPDMLVRYYFPYAWIVCGMALISLFITKIELLTWASHLMLALYSGNNAILKTVTQMSMLWFLPSFFALVIIRSIFSNSILGKVFLLTLTIIIHPVLGEWVIQVRDYLPIGLLPILYVIPLLFFIATAQQVLFDKIPKKQAFLMVTLSFITVKYFQIQLGAAQELGFAEVATYKTPLNLLVNDFEAITGVLMLFQISRFNFDFNYFRFIEMLGKNSLQVYLCHGFIALVIYKFTQKIPVFPPSFLLIISFIFASFLAGLFAKFLTSNRWTSRFLFPKNWKDLIKKK